VGPWQLLFLAFGMALFLEGLPYFVAPASARRAMVVMSQMRDGALRALGLVWIALGLAVAYFATR